jgi:threonine/homoserine/homoserine lactone efflux protein
LPSRFATLYAAAPGQQPKNSGSERIALNIRFDVLSALVLFCVVAGVTPGPNNMMLMASGVNFGVRRTLPHLAGVVAGFALMVALVGFGLDAVFRVAPWLLPVMRWAGAAYLVWLAWRVAVSGAAKEGAAGGHPIGLFGAAAFQWINPKGWIMAVSALTTYAVSADYTTTVMVVALTCLIVSIPCSGVWVLFGAAMRRFLADPRRARPFNWTMAALLVASIAPVFWE